MLPSQPQPMPGSMAALSLELLSPELLSPEACRRLVLGLWNPDGPACPLCGERFTGAAAVRFWRGTRTSCPHCRRVYSPWASSPLAGCRLGPRQLLVIALMAAAGCPTSVIADAAKVSVPTARAWQHRTLTEGPARAAGQAQINAGA